MNICLTNLSFLKKNFSHFINKVNDLGYKNIEIAPYLISIDPFTKKNALELKKKIKNNKIKIQSIQSLFFLKKNLNCEKEKLRYFKKIFIFANFLEVNKVSLGSAPFRKIKKTYNNILKNKKLIIKLSNLAKKYKINVCIEPISNKYSNVFFNNHHEVINLIKKIKKNNIKLLFDFGNFEEEKKFNLDNFFIKYINYIDHIHIRDSNMKKISKKNIKEKIMFLKKHRYNKTLTIEYLNNNGLKLPNINKLL